MLPGCVPLLRRAGRGTLGLLLGLLLVLGLLPGIGGTTAAATTTPAAPDPGTSDDLADTGEPAAGDATPLTLRLRSLAPAVVPVAGPVLMSGSVTNDSDEPWLDVNVAPFVGDTALTTRDELSEAVQTPEEAAVGARLSEQGTFASVGDLEPGESVDFSVTVPRDSLPPESEAGVYWIGVHALGTGPEGRDSVADGRARTFVVLPPRTAPQEEGTAPGDDEGAATPQQPDVATATGVPLSLVLPLREGSPRAPDGSLAEPERWVRTVQADGRLARISRFADAAGDLPLGWLVDPAVLDALDDLGRGDPALSLGPPDDSDPGTGSPGPTATPDQTQGPDATPTTPDGAPSDDPSDDPGDDPGEGQPTGPDGPPEEEQPSDAPGAAEAREVADRLAARLVEDRVLATPYADTDTTALLRRAPGLAVRAVEETGLALERRGLDGQTVLASPSGRVEPRLLDRLPAEVGLVLADGGDLEVAAAGTYQERPALLADTRASGGGPAPTPAHDALTLRQQLLAETLLESQRPGGPRPVVVVLPRDWDPGADWEVADLFGALDVPWVRWAAPPVSSEPLDLDLEYPAAVEQREVGDANVAAARDLVAAGAALDGLLTSDNDVRSRTTAAALQAVSYDARARREGAAEAARALTRTVEADLGRVGVFGSEFVTLSGGSGTLTVTVVNDLGQPVEVAVQVRTDAGVRVEQISPVALGPEQRVTVRVPVTSDTGVHEVTLVPVTTAGVPAGATFDFVLRTSQVGVAVWVVMAAAGLVFAVSLARRLVRRFRPRGRVRTRAGRMQDAP